MRSPVLFLACLAILASCFSEKDYNFENITVTPTYAFPIAFGDVGLLNLLKSEDSAYVRAYPDGLLYFYYQQTLGSTNIRDLFELPENNSTTSFDMPAGTLPASSTDLALGNVNRQIDLNLSPEQLTEILLKGGTLSHIVGFTGVPNPPNLPIEAKVILLDVVHKTSLQPLTYTAANGSDSRSLQDYVMHLLDNKFDIRVEFVIKPHPATFIPAGTKASVQLKFADMAFSYIKGFLGDQVAQLPPQTMDLSVFGASLKDAGVSFVQPTISLDVVNEYGADCEISFSKLQANKGVSSLSFQINPTSPVNLSKPTVMGTSAATHVEITNQQALLNLAPEQLEYEASARINKGLSNATNFMADTSKLRVTLTTEIPIYGRVSGVVKLDTMDIDLGDVDESKVNSSSLRINATNEMPLDVFMQIYLADSTYQIVDSLFATNETYIVKASTVDGAGDLQTAGVTNVQFGLEETTLDKLFDSKFLILKAMMNTAKDANGTPLNVKFRASYRLKINVGLLAKFNVTLK